MNQPVDMTAPKAAGQVGVGTARPHILPPRPSPRFPAFICIYLRSSAVEMHQSGFVAGNKPPRDSGGMGNVKNLAEQQAAYDGTWTASV